MDLGLRDHVAVITGASGGIGRALARAFADEGARLGLIAGKNLAALDAWVDAEGLRDRAVTATADVTDAASLDRAFAAIATCWGRVDHAVVNAGVWPSEPVGLHALPVDRLRHTLDVDLVGALLTARAFLARLADAGPRDDAGASLTFIGSTAGAFGEAWHVDYAAAKAGLRGATLSLKNEIVHLDPRGRVNLVEPGWTRTPMAAQAMEDGAAVARSLSTTPLARVAEPEDVAAAGVFLASPARAGHLTGQILGVHGGMEGRRLR